MGIPCSNRRVLTDRGYSEPPYNSSEGRSHITNALGESEIVDFHVYPCSGVRPLGLDILYQFKMILECQNTC